MKTVMMVVLLACAGTTAGYAQGESEGDVGAKILAMERVWSNAYVLKDPKALERILDDTFVNVDSDGRLQNKADLLAEVKTSSVLQFLTESMAVHLHGDTAIVTGIFVINGVERGKPYAQRDRFVDTWFYKNGQWVSIAGVVAPVGN
jgi:ketosteroid isomerase-like protein